MTAGIGSVTAVGAGMGSPAPGMGMTALGMGASGAGIGSTAIAAGCEVEVGAAAGTSDAGGITTGCISLACAGGIGAAGDGADEPGGCAGGVSAVLVPMPFTSVDGVSAGAAGSDALQPSPMPLSTMPLSTIGRRFPVWRHAKGRKSMSQPTIPGCACPRVQLRKASLKDNCSEPGVATELFVPFTTRCHLSPMSRHRRSR